MAERFAIRMAVYIIFVRGNEVLLSLRKNTGFKDGFYGWVQGHVEQGEEIKATALREVAEEVGVQVAPTEMRLAAVVHQQIEMPYMDFVFVCRKWSGQLANMEEAVCAEVKWFPVDNLPGNILPQVREYVRLINSDGLEFFELK